MNGLDVCNGGAGWTRDGDLHKDEEGGEDSFEDLHYWWGVCSAGMISRL
jgi:hypothetical protein